MALDLKDDLLKNARAVIWKREGDTMLFLITQESSGSFSLPGGCKDLEDADIQTALCRELKEELGLDPGDYSVVNTGIQKEYENFYPNPESERFGKKTIASLFTISNLTKEPTPSNEIKALVWMTEEEVLKAFNKAHMKELFELGRDAVRN
ncbi:MAG TPA: NUDIX domain-containing protein [Candidatus Paceibacterota bacterium]|nr:NUDIX domain-containing protein [Candidatus Paceibacterota bacterium]